MKISLIAHDKKKVEMLNFVKENEKFFNNHELFATNTTGQMITKETSLKVKCLLSGPLGGDQQIGALVATKEINVIFFFRDPLTAQPHEPDVSALMRICDVHNVPIATNVESGKLIIQGINR